MAKTPFDPADFMKNFDPEAMRKMFDPKSMMAMFQQPGMGNLDVTKAFETSKGQFEAMAEANKAAAEGYKDMMEKQMSLMQDVLAPAQKMIAEAGDPEVVKARTEKLNAAMAEGLTLMKTLADNTRKANEEAFAGFKAQVEGAVKAATKK